MFWPLLAYSRALSSCVPYEGGTQQRKVKEECMRSLIWSSETLPVVKGRAPVSAAVECGEKFSIFQVEKVGVRL